MIKEVLLILVGYLLGSVLFCYFLPKLFYNKDVRKYGSKNPGARNTYRLFGNIGIVCGVFDALKTAFIIILASYMTQNVFVVYAAGIASVLGHIFPIYHKFKGGLGVACSYGFLFAILVLLFINPLEYSGIMMILLIFYIILTMSLADKINKTKKINYKIK